MAGGRDDSYVDTDRSDTIDAHERLMGERAQQACLDAEIHVDDVLQKQGAAVGLLQRAEVHLLTILHTEQLGGRVGVCEPGDGHSDEGTVTPVARLVQVAGINFLAAARLAYQQHGSVVLGDAFNLFAQILHERAAPDGLGDGA